MMAKRKVISKQVRFEVFKRDKFTCQYCGRCAPEVTLQVDHINPVSKGGQNDIVNLITSCFDCNNGKSDKNISDDSAIKKQKKQLDLLQERREQLEMMMNWSKGLLDIEEQKVNSVKEYWSNLAINFSLTESGTQDLRKLLKKFQVDEILTAMNITSSNYFKWDGDKLIPATVDIAFNKLGSICTMERLSKENPDIKQFYYIRGILRNRITYHDPQKTIDYLSAARSWGASIEELKQIACTVKNWTAFVVKLSDLIAQYKSEQEGAF